MKRILAIAAIAAPLAFSATSSQAAPASPLGLAGQPETSAVTLVEWGRCRHWRRECAERWPMFGWRFRRCLVIHGCGW
jgi:hypothetical protein